MTPVASITPGAVFEHYKKKLYQVIDVARHSETMEWFVVYIALENNNRWIRPLDMFLENVTIDGEVMPRFRLVTS